ncbi:hypothetical protein BN59_02741 [Legionella massiliensis]|uniref:Uncharacterized protein n=1 Tax=Legionella massiliensis TaxID=1034943 RepID=A0A078KZY8_9GAMM|nr:hypothetical protein BN59_02741 [Legionella massiliensis]CEE14169.1 hypothetical protein BN1094_02741 [Legionella massiliensis]
MVIVAKNTLYQFLLSFKQEAAERSIRIEQDSNRKQVPYLRISLPEIDSTPLKLLAHHISVYASESESNPFLSQYHYTGMFMDEHGHTWKAHLYFNEEDLIIHSSYTPVKSSVVSSSTDTISHEPTKLPCRDEEMFPLVESVCKPVMSIIRARFNHKVSSLCEAYQRLEQEAAELSKDPRCPHYPTKLAEICEVLQELDPLVRHSNYWAIQKFIERLLGSIKTDLSPLEPIQEEPISMSSPSSSSSSSSSADHQSLSFFSQAPIKPKKGRQLDEQALEDLSLRFANLKVAKPEEQAQQFTYLFAKLNSLALLARGNTLARLHQFYQDMRIFGEQVYKRALLLGYFEAAATMTMFHYLLSDQYMELALHLRKAPLLEFVLQYGDKSLLKRPVKVKDLAFPSSVHACIGLDKSSSPMQDCLAVLVKYGASMLQRFDNGLPIGHIILSRKQSTLMGALDRYPDSTYYCPAFFNHLISALTVFINSHPEMSEEERESLEASIKFYFLKKTAANWTQYMQTSAAGRKYLKDIRARKDFIDKFPNLGKIMNDFDLLVLVAEEQELEMQYLQRCSESDRQRWFKSSGAIAKANIDADIVSLLETMPSEAWKQVMLNQHSKGIATLNLAYETLLQENKIKRKSNHQTPRSRTTHVLCENMVRAESQITQLSDKFRKIREKRELEESIAESTTEASYRL